MNDRIIYKITENNKKAFKRLLENNKDNKTDEDIISRKAINIWKSTNADDDFISKNRFYFDSFRKKRTF